MLQPKKPVVKKATKKTNNDVQMYKGPKGEVLSGEGTNRGPNYNMLKKNGGKVMKKAQGGTSLTKGIPSIGAYKTGGKMKKAANGTTTTAQTTEYPKAERGLAERAGAMLKTKTKVRSADGNYVTKTVTTSKPNSKNSITKTRRTLQGYLAGAPKVNDLKNGGKMKKAKGGFDLNKDGKTTFKDVLIGRGVLPKNAKSGGKIKKAQNSIKFGDMGKSTSSMPSIPTGNNAGSSQKTVKAKSGGTMKKCKYGCK